ncbi:AAA family ATPase [Fusarium austroafricanum]|uniref:AAA family ATPase n=1 Tax=Fusarium austroafricanum TaxID=2364996 RepID=A0A8H4KGP8_9HYPO|nr:AAA family ATPase [Fusarium austroafricanum]
MMADATPSVTAVVTETETSGKGSSPPASPIFPGKMPSDSTDPSHREDREKPENNLADGPEETYASSEKGGESDQAESLHEEEEGQNGDDDDDASETFLPVKDRPLTVDVRYYNYQGFMNRMDGDEGDYVIEALVARADWHEDVGIESNKLYERMKPNYSRSNDTAGAQLKLSKGSKSPQTQDGRIQRIRIRSQTILGALGSLAEFSDMEESSVVEFNRPFRILEDHHDGMKRKLVEMENAHKPESGSPVAGSGSPQTFHVSSEEFIEAGRPMASGDGFDKTIEDDNVDSKTALEHMRCYVNFMEVLLPIRSRFQYFGKNSRQRVRHEEIPCLFRPGSLAFVPFVEPGQTLHRSAAQHVWRMASCHVANYPHDFDYDEGHFKKGVGETKWDMYCFDYDGEKLLPIWHHVKFELFDGERDVTSLPCYPLEFYPKHASLIEEQKIWGRAFKLCIAEGVKHIYYSGWTFITGILAEPLEDDKGQLINYPEYTESEVIIDFKETVRAYPTWETNAGEYEISDELWGLGSYAEKGVHVWEEYPSGLGGRRRYRTETFDFLYEESPPYSRESKEWIENDKFIVAKNALAISDDEWTDEDLALLPKRLFGYVLRERRFARLDVQGIDLTSQQSHVTLDDIQMPELRRKIIRSAVSAHFRSQQKEKQGLSTIQLDVVRGKGKGLVILLHGAPGVGKTATAEAVAIENNKPLFPITCGDLGFSPSVVDKSLRDTFRYAYLWDCILLLDEADVFLTQRDRGGGNLERNALVGVFLRVLEYYSGILFLTTNRVGALDEAFRSRVHLSLCYPHLSLDDTIQILQSNLNRLPRIEHAKDRSSIDGYIKVMDNEIRKFVEDEYKKYSRANKKKKGPWNGRQIRNAVQIAAGLALYDKENPLDNNEADGMPAILTAGHFQSVADTTTEFEAYLKSTKKGDETFQARLRQDRDDDFQEDAEEEEYGHYSGSFDTEPYEAPQRPRLTNSVSGPSRTRHMGSSRAAATPDRNRKASLFTDRTSGDHFGSAKSSPGPGHPGRRSRYPPQTPEFREVDENMQDSFFEGDEFEEFEHREYSHTPLPASKDSKLSQLRR